MRLTPLLLAAALIGCAATQPAAPPAPVPMSAASAPITLSMRSWGREFVRWRIGPDGQITLARAKDAPMSEPVTFTEQRTGPAPDRYVWVERQLKALRAKAGSDLPCTQEVTDMPYGEVSWGEEAGAAKVSFYTACSEKRTRELLVKVDEVGKQIVAWVQKDAVPTR